MNINIFVEPSTTTLDVEGVTLRGYYRGLFKSIVTLEEDLSSYGNTNLHIFSEEYGVANGSDLAEEVINSDEPAVGYKTMVDSAKDQLLEAAPKSDVMVILLSTQVCQDTVDAIWEKLTDAAKPESIWCIGAAQSCLIDLDFQRLKEKDINIITYRRVGVARLGNEKREELIEIVEKQSS